MFKGNNTGSLYCSSQELRGVLTVEEARGLTSDELIYRRALGWLMPIAGADGDGDGDGDGDADAAAAKAAADKAAADKAAADKDGDGDDDGPNDDPDDVLELRRADYERLRQIAREHDASVKKAATEEAERKRKAQIEQGKFEELIREETTARTAVEAERDAARNELVTERRTRRVEAVAKRLGFKDAADAMLFISDEDGDDDAAAERALKKVARNKPYLIDSRRPNGLPIGGNGGSILTLEQVKNMSADEINANWAEVQKVMSAQ